MNWDAIGAIGESIGAIGVIVSVIYLAIQVGRNTRTAQGAAAAQSIEAFSSINQMILQQPDLARLVKVAMDTKCDVNSLSGDEKDQLILMFRMIFQQFEAQFFLYKSGVLPKELWENRRSWAHSFLTLPVWQEWWAVESQTPGYTPGFIENVLDAPTFALDAYHHFPE